MWDFETLESNMIIARVHQPTTPPTARCTNRPTTTVSAKPRRSNGCTILRTNHRTTAVPRTSPMSQPEMGLSFQDRPTTNRTHGGRVPAPQRFSSTRITLTQRRAMRQSQHPAWHTVHSCAIRWALTRQTPWPLKVVSAFFLVVSIFRMSYSWVVGDGPKGIRLKLVARRFVCGKLWWTHETYQKERKRYHVLAGSTLWSKTTQHWKMSLLLGASASTPCETSLACEGKHHTGLYNEHNGLRFSCTFTYIILRGRSTCLGGSIAIKST